MHFAVDWILKVTARLRISKLISVLDLIIDLNFKWMLLWCEPNLTTKKNKTTLSDRTPPESYKFHDSFSFLFTHAEIEGWQIWLSTSLVKYPPTLLIISEWVAVRQTRSSCAVDLKFIVVCEGVTVALYPQGHVIFSWAEKEWFICSCVRNTSPLPR